MSKSIKFKNNNYLDSSGIMHSTGGSYNRQTLKSFLPQGSTDSAFYSTQYLQLGYIDCSLVEYSEWSNLTLLISSVFYGVQHWSTHLLTLAQADYIKAFYLKVGGNDRKFYYKKDTTNKRIYIYAYVTGGNGFGNWVVSLLSKWQCYWTTEIKHNITYESSWVEIGSIS